MKHFEIEVLPKKEFEIIDITKKVKDFIKKSNVINGIALIFTKHTTTAIKINENESGLFSDLKWLLESLVPKHRDYLHNESDDERKNGHSHLKSLLLNSSETIPIVNSKLALGVWQSIFFIDLDGKDRKRTVIIQILD